MGTDQRKVGVGMARANLVGYEVVGPGERITCIPRHCLADSARRLLQRCCRLYVFAVYEGPGGRIAQARFILGAPLPPNVGTPYWWGERY